MRTNEVSIRSLELKYYLFEKRINKLVLIEHL